MSENGVSSCYGGERRGRNLKESNDLFEANYDKIFGKPNDDVEWALNASGTRRTRVEKKGKRKHAVS